jgi:hypothetical protein
LPILWPFRAAFFISDIFILHTHNYKPLTSTPQIPDTTT